ncbi:transposase [Neobacillus soli]|uniref:transposase n=1 Tax=Neobacillus soli TaxID=220688 RepID=UPI000AEBBC3A|nr:transposase [Neobacillus soli]
MMVKKMRTKNRLVADETKYFRPEFSNCPTCQSKLDYCHTVSKKTISTLNGVKTIINMGYRCTNPNCENGSTVFRSAQAEHLSVKHITYGMDVLALVGELRFKERKTRKEIMDILNRRGVVVSERHVQKLYERYAVLLRASAEDTIKEILKKTVDTHKGIILSMDGMQLEKGKETLYIIREVLSGTILAAKNVVSSSTEELLEFIKPIIDYGFPILGFVSDGKIQYDLHLKQYSPIYPINIASFTA